MLLAAIILTLPADAQTSSPSTLRPVQISGPLVAKPLLEALAEEYGKTHPSFALDYQRMDLASGAVNALLSGRDAVLTYVPIGEAAVAERKVRWKGLDPQEHLLGLRAIALVVHPRNAVDNLTMEQLQAIYSGKIANWKVLGGEDKPIRRYGLAPTDPLAVLFHAKVLSADKCPLLQRKKSSDDLATALASDPQGIGFLDMTLAATNAQTLKTLGISDGKKAVLPNAQTLQDGTYRLGEPLLLYVPAEAKADTKAFVEFLVSEKTNAFYRQHGLTPAMRPLGEDVAEGFDRLYGAELRRVQKTPEPDDDIALALQILDAARTTKLSPAMLSTLCQTAFGLTEKASGGQVAAFESLAVWWDKVPEKRFEAGGGRVALYRRAYEQTKGRPEAEQLLTVLMLAADAGIQAQAYAASATLWQEGLEVAQTTQSPRMVAFQARSAAFQGRVQSLQEKQKLREQLRTGSLPLSMERRLLWLTGVELDDPSSAAKLIDTSTEEEFKNGSVSDNTNNNW